MSLQLTYENLNADDLRGATLADYLISIEADFEIRDERGSIYAEAAFPVAELARQLSMWLAACGDEKQEDFGFDSLSFAEPGAVRVFSVGDMWSVGSRLTPDQQSTPQDWEGLTSTLSAFIARVRTDIHTLGFDASFTLE